MNWASRIIAMRQALMLSQDELAEKIGATQPTIARWEAGEHCPRPKYQRKLTEIECEAAKQQIQKPNS